MPRYREHLIHHYFRSLFALYHLDDMIALDIPWWTYPAIRYIEDYIQNLKVKPRVFEYGSGASTLWLAKRAQSVISVEHNKAWYDQLQMPLKTAPNVALQLYPDPSFSAYAAAIQTTSGLFDIIIIDGRARAACLAYSLDKLHPQGIIIFDNTNRPRYQTALCTSQLNIQRFPGWVPGSPLKSETSILRSLT